MKKFFSVTFSLIVAFLLVGCSKTPTTDVFRFEIREANMIIGEEKELALIIGDYDFSEVCFEKVTGEGNVEIVNNENGKITIKATGLGSLEYSAFIENQPNVKDIIPITVEEPRIDYINIITESNTLYIGNTMKVEADYFPKSERNELVYEVSNTQICSIDENNNLLGIKPGNVVIKVYDKNDESFYAVKNITVSYVPAVDIQLIEENITVNAGEPYTINVNVLNEDGTTEGVNQTVSLTSSNTNSLKVNGNIITGITKGSYRITVRVPSTTLTKTINVTIIPAEDVTVSVLGLNLSSDKSTALSKLLYVENLLAEIVGVDEKVVAINSTKKNIQPLKVGIAKIRVYTTDGKVDKEIDVVVKNILFDNDFFTTKSNFILSDYEADEFKVISNITVETLDGVTDFEVSSSDDSIARVEKVEGGIIVTLLKKGKFTLTITSGYAQFSKQYTVK